MKRPTINLAFHFRFTWLIIVISLVKISQANFNLYLSKAEVKRILGLNAELYYIREGVVNDYAMKFSVKVPPEIHSIFFQWESLAKRPVLYNMAVWINETSIKDGLNPITEPSLNISLSGTIPKKTETFELNLPCTGLMNGEVEVILNMNVTAPRPNQPPTVLYFTRRKICLKGIGAEKLLPRKSLQQPELEEEVQRNAEEEGLPLFVYIVYGIVSLGLVIAIITAVACWKAYHKMRKYPFPAIHQPIFISSAQNERKSTSTLQKSSTSHIDNVYTSPSVLYTGPSALYTGPSGTYTLPSAMTGNSYASVYKFPFQSTDITGSVPPCRCTDSSCSGIYEYSCYSNSNSKSESYMSSRDSKEEEKFPLKCKFDKCCEKPNGFRLDASELKERFRQLQMDRERVRLTEVLQEGRVGRVYKGWLQREHPELDQQVIIKTLREGSSSGEVDSLCREGTLLSGLRHQNLMSLVGMSFVSNSPPFLIFPDPQGKNFKQFLKASPLPLKVCDLIEVCLQVTKGLNFMHANHLLHQDVAARNCIISEQYHVRLSDSALARDFFPEDYECHEIGPESGIRCSYGGSERGHLYPVRWMAPEALQDPNQTSSFSDVWSLGILLWEASTGSERPYSGISSFTLRSFLDEGHRLPQSPTCPDEIHRVISACWSANVSQRPSTQQVIDFLSAFKENLTSFV